MECIKVFVAYLGLIGLLSLLQLTSCGHDSTAGTRSDLEIELEACLQRSDGAAALALLEGLADEDQNQAFALHARGRAILLGAGDYGTAEARRATAESLYRKALESNPGASKVLLDLARLLADQGRWVEGMTLLERGRRADPQNPRFAFGIARIYLTVSEVEEAQRALEDGLALAPESAEGLLLEGVLLFDYLAQHDKGLAVLRRALSLDSEVAGGRETLSRSLALMARMLESQDDKAGALALVTEGLRWRPDDPVLCLDRARLLIQGGDLEGGLDALRRFCRAEPKNDEAATLLGSTLISVGYKKLIGGKQPQALALFEEAVVLAAKDVDLTAVTGILDEHRRAGATAEVGEPHEKDASRLARELFVEGSHLLEEGRAEEAVAKLEASLGLLPGNPFAHHQLGLALVLSQKLDEGERQLREAIRLAEELEVDLPEAYIKLAELSFRLGRTEACRDCLTSFERRFPERAQDYRVTSLRSLLAEPAAGSKGTPDEEPD